MQIKQYITITITPTAAAAAAAAAAATAATTFVRQSSGMLCYSLLNMLCATRETFLAKSRSLLIQ